MPDKTEPEITDSQNSESENKQENGKPGLLGLIWRHKIATLCGSGAAFVWLAFAQNLINAEIACSINFAQPTASDVCGYFGLGDKPKRGERLDWEALAAQLSPPSSENCTALQAHVRTYSDGAFAAEANRLVNNPLIDQIESWVPEQRTLPAFEAIPEAGFPTRGDAETEVLLRAESNAERQCEGYTQGGIWRVQSLSLTDMVFDCDQSAGAHFCSLEATTVCGLERRVITEERLCGLQVD